MRSKRSAEDLLAWAKETADDIRTLPKDWADELRRLRSRIPDLPALFAEAVERLTKASRHNQEFVERIEKRATERARQDAAKSAEATGREKGLSAETIDAIKRNILGVKPAPPAGGVKA
jgi:flagellar biosynthesis/type III secretory pathway protein FliH